MAEVVRYRLRDAVAPENASIFSPFDGKDTNGFNGIPDLEQLMRMDPQFSSDMLVDTDVMSMWSAAPSGFQ